MMMLLLFRACVLLLIPFGCLSQKDQPTTLSAYCKVSLNHTLCQFQGIGEKCDALSVRGLDDRSRQIVLQTHNALRSLVASGNETRGSPGPQPQAANMQVMMWDDELATVAQRWADQCQFVHDCNDCRKVGRFPVGQNLGLEWTTGPALAANWKKMITKWYEEVQEFPSTSASRYKFAMETGHYSQMIWAQTNRVGCGYASYRDNSTQETGPVQTNLYVCNYGPAGNFIETPVYKTGTACSQCPANTVCSTQWSHLCESAKKPTGNSSSTTPVGSNKVVPPSTPLPRPVTESTLSTTTETPTTTFSPSPSVSTTAIRTEPTTKAPPALEQPDADVPCIVGSVQCPAAYRGASWSWRQETSTISPNFLETSVDAGHQTELQLKRQYPAPDQPKGEVCISLKLRQQRVAEGWMAPPLIIKIQPENQAALMVPIQSGEQGRWVQLKMTLSRIRAPFQVLLQQSGPLLADPTLSSPSDFPVTLRVAVEQLNLKNGNCQP